MQFGCAIVIRFITDGFTYLDPCPPRVAGVSKPRRIPPWMAGSGIIAVAMGLMNLGTYGFTLVAARVLGPQEYGAVAALMGLLLVLAVLSLGFQASAARRVSVAPQNQPQTEADVVDAVNVGAAALTVLVLLATPLVSATLRLEPWWAAAVLAAAVLPLTLMGAYAGIFQGEARWKPLAAVYVGVGAGRLVFGVLGMVLGGGALGALVGVAIGNAVPALLGWWFLKHPSRSTPRTAPVSPPVRATRVSRRSVLAEVAHDCHALLAFLAMSNVDVIIARRVLTEHDAGLYAAGLIMTKAVLFLPQFVVVLAFPSMVRDGRSRRQTQALLLILAMGTVATAGAWLLAPLAVTFVGGEAYAELESTIWGFAALGGLLAMIQLVVYGSMARQHRAAVGLLWGGLAALVVAAFFVSSTTELLSTAAAVHLTVLTALMVVSRRRVRAGFVPTT